LSHSLAVGSGLRLAGTVFALKTFLSENLWRSSFDHFDLVDDDMMGSLVIEKTIQY
jgi:hypothetical protein